MNADAFAYCIAIVNLYMYYCILWFLSTHHFICCIGVHCVNANAFAYCIAIVNLYMYYCILWFLSTHHFICCIGVHCVNADAFAHCIASQSVHVLLHSLVFKHPSFHMLYRCTLGEC